MEKLEVEKPGVSKPDVSKPGVSKPILAKESGRLSFFAERLDQLFVLLQHWVEGLLPARSYNRLCRNDPGRLIAIVAAFPGIFALTTVLERKGLGRIQNRLGPNRVGPLRRPAADCRRHQVA